MQKTRQGRGSSMGLELSKGSSLPTLGIIIVMVMVTAMGFLMVASDFEDQYGKSNESVLIGSDMLNRTSDMTEAGSSIFEGYILLFLLLGIVAVMLIAYGISRR